jgi:hypothetical protein
MGRRLILLIAGLLALAAPAHAQSRFSHWAAAVVSADWRDHEGHPIAGFDNARRDVVAGLLDAGFSRANLVDYSLRPDVPNPVEGRDALRGIAEAAGRAQDGCLLYFTSHGAPDAMVFGPDGVVTPDMMANMVRSWCGARPTVLIVSACYSGIFVDGLKAPNRMILTAASRDRTSFGCGANETYPWFDACVLEALPQASDFLALAAGARACVARREQEAGVTLPSEPQLFVGAEMQMRLPTLRFTRPPG